MPRQEHNIQGLKGSRNDYSVANSARFSWTGADVVEGETGCSTSAPMIRPFNLQF